MKNRQPFTQGLALGLALLATLSLEACAKPAAEPQREAAPPAPATPPARALVKDLVAFQTFIGTRPTPEQFRARYPGVTLILPNTIATRELRLDNSRYFADLDAQGHIVGGKFQ